MEQFRIHSKSWMDTDFASTPELTAARRIGVHDIAVANDDPPYLRIRRLWQWLLRTRSAYARLSRASVECQDIETEV